MSAESKDEGSRSGSTGTGSDAEPSGPGADGGAASSAVAGERPVAGGPSAATPRRPASGPLRHAVLDEVDQLLATAVPPAGIAPARPRAVLPSIPDVLPGRPRIAPSPAAIEPVARPLGRAAAGAGEPFIPPIVASGTGATPAFARPSAPATPSAPSAPSAPGPTAQAPQPAPPAAAGDVARAAASGSAAAGARAPLRSGPASVGPAPAQFSTPAAQATWEPVGHTETGVALEGRASLFDSSAADAEPGAESEPTDPSIVPADVEAAEPASVPQAEAADRDAEGGDTDPAAHAPASAPGTVPERATAGVAGEWLPEGSGEGDLGDDPDDRNDRGWSREDTQVLDPAIQDRLMALRAQQDQILRSRFGGEVVVMFTDLVGSTAYYEQHGDLMGRQKMLTHNALLFPIVRSHDGSIIKTIGDSIMACFATVDGCLDAAVQMQRALQEHNRGCQDPDDQIHIRVGINAGSVIAEDGDIHGDAVNVASRVQSVANGGDILVSAGVATKAPERDLEPLGPIVFRGKAEAIDVFRLRWGGQAGPVTPPVRVISTRYRLGEAVARGPIGVVHAAHDTRLLVPVVVKLVHPFVVDSPDGPDRFHVKVQTMASLVHDRIVRVLDCSPPGTREPFYVADRIDGPDLTLWVARNGTPDPRRAVRIVQELCDPVAFAHRRGVVHGNIKPENVLVGPDNQTFLCDFGLWELGNAVAPGSPVASPAYFAPEQVTGGRVDARTDVYGLGALLYFLLCGRAPYETVATFKAVRAVVSGMFTRIERVRGDLPASLCRLLGRAMDADRDARFRTVEELAKALGPYADAPSPDLRGFDSGVDGGFGRAVRSSDAAVSTRPSSAAAAATAPSAAVLPDPSRARDEVAETTFVGPPPAETEETRADEPTYVGPPPDDRGAREGPEERTFVGPAPVDGAVPTTWLDRPRDLRRLLAASTLAVLVCATGWLVAVRPSEAPKNAAVAPMAAVAPGDEAAPNSGDEAPAHEATEGQLVLTTEPWAEVFVNRQRIGRTPEVHTIWLTEGKHVLTLSHPKMQRFEETVEIVPGESVVRHVTLKRSRRK